MLRVLVIDDEPTVRRGILLGVDWASLDCLVVGEASDGAEGLEAVDRCHPDLIITDIRMPKMDGIQMLTALRERGCRAYVILLTAYSDFAYARSALQLGAEDYLLKPFQDQELVTAILRVQQKLLRQATLAQSQILPPARTDTSRHVQEAIGCIARHYADPDISITTIASQLGVSEGHLSHVFKKETGCTVLSYLTRYRIQTAMRLLREGKLRIYEVAAQVGYRDVTYFSSCFKKVAGVTPSEFQENPQNL